MGSVETHGGNCIGLYAFFIRTHRPEFAKYIVYWQYNKIQRNFKQQYNYVGFGSNLRIKFSLLSLCNKPITISNRTTSFWDLIPLNCVTYAHQFHPFNHNPIFDP